jgi:hypothetical protein
MEEMGLGGRPFIREEEKDILKVESTVNKYNNFF